MGNMNVALVQDDTVHNVVVVDESILWFPPDGYETVNVDPENPIGIGWIRTDGVWSAPPRPEE